MNRPLFTITDIPLQSRWQSPKGTMEVKDRAVNWLGNFPTDIITHLALTNTATNNTAWVHIDLFYEMLNTKTLKRI